MACGSHSLEVFSCPPTLGPSPEVGWLRCLSWGCHSALSLLPAVCAILGDTALSVCPQRRARAGSGAWRLPEGGASLGLVLPLHPWPVCRVVSGLPKKGVGTGSHSQRVQGGLGWGRGAWPISGLVLELAMSSSCWRLRHILSPLGWVPFTPPN